MPTPLAELQLLRIACIEQNEKDGDEIYVLFTAKRRESGVVGQERVPGDMGNFKMTSGKEVTPNHLLYIDEVGSGLSLTLTVMEMDILRVFKNSFSVVGTWIDDYVGQVSLDVSDDGKLMIHTAKHTKELTEGASSTDGIHRFALTGNRSQYVLELRLQLGGKDLG